jgi:hypothetical protein
MMPSPVTPVSALSETSETPKVRRGAQLRGRDEQDAEHERARLEGHQAGHREGRVTVGVRQREDEHEQADRRHGHAGPLTGADDLTEELRAENGEHHDAGGHDRLDGGQRRHGERGDVQDPGARCNGHADREPLRREQAAGALERTARVDRRRARRPTVLAEKAQLRGRGAGKRQHDPEFQDPSPLRVVPIAAELPSSATSHFPRRRMPSACVSGIVGHPTLSALGLVVPTTAARGGWVAYRRS